MKNARTSDKTPSGTMVGVPKVYRYAPWLVLTAAGAILVIAMAVPVVGVALRTPTVDTIVKATLGLAVLAALEALLLLTWRVRTVVDDEGVTQHWIMRRFHLPYEDITALETERTDRRWFVRVHCGDRTFEVIPCPSPLATLFPGATQQLPRVLMTARDDIQDRWDRSRQAA